MDGVVKPPDPEEDFGKKRRTQLIGNRSQLIAHRCQLIAKPAYEKTSPPPVTPSPYSLSLRYRDLRIRGGKCNKTPASTTEAGLRKTKKPTQRRVGRIVVFNGSKANGWVSANRATTMVRLYKQFNITQIFPKKQAIILIEEDKRRRKPRVAQVEAK